VELGEHILLLMSMRRRTNGWREGVASSIGSILVFSGLITAGGGLAALLFLI
jgi:hypothetical protein